MAILAKMIGVAIVHGGAAGGGGDAAVATGKVRRRTKTREALLLAARTLMVARQKDGFTIDDVVQLAGVAKGSFYNHFPDKEALADEVYRETRAKEESEIEAVNRAVDDPMARVARAMALYARLALTSPEEAGIITMGQVSALSIRSSANAGLVRDLREGLQAGKIVVPSIEAGAMLVIGQTAVLMSRLKAPREHGSACDLAQQCIALTLVGLGLEHRAAHQLSAQAVEGIVRGVLPEGRPPS